ncbi:hypothetical protein [Kitasatospora sp. NPDC056531]|uniref:hypothetical protein n=1 Tax=Kitasatospora sp. NPDC056531 TaxID=3345856 RepID=UPI0036BC93E4
MTRLTGWLALLAAIRAGWLELRGVLTLTPVPPTDRVRPIAEAAVCVLLWIVVSLAARNVVRPRLGRDTRLVGAALGLTLGLFCLDAALPAFGQHGAEARWESQVRQAGGGQYDLPVSRVLSTPRQMEVMKNQKVQYAADVEVEVPWTSGPRPLTLRDRWFIGEPVVGDRTEVVYAPTRPDLGARAGVSGGILSDLFGYVALLAGVGACLVLTVSGAGNPELVAGLRRFRPGLHLPALAAVTGAAGLDAVVLFTFPSGLLSWLLALSATGLTALTGLWMLITVEPAHPSCNGASRGHQRGLRREEEFLEAQGRSARRLARAVARRVRP